MITSLFVEDIIFSANADVNYATAWEIVPSDMCVPKEASWKRAYIMLTLLNPTFI